MASGTVGERDARVKQPRDELLVATAALDRVRCDGVRLRGDAAMKELCACHAPEPFKR